MTATLENVRFNVDFTFHEAVILAWVIDVRVIGMVGEKERPLAVHTLRHVLVGALDEVLRDRNARWPVDEWAENVFGAVLWGSWDGKVPWQSSPRMRPGFEKFDTRDDDFLEFWSRDGRAAELLAKVRALTTVDALAIYDAVERLMELRTLPSEAADVRADDTLEKYLKHVGLLAPGSNSFFNVPRPAANGEEEVARVRH